MSLLDVRNLTTRIATSRGVMNVVEDVSFTVQQGECFGIVGESGSGKSMTCRSILGLLSKSGRTTGAAWFEGQDLLTLKSDALEQIRGRQIAMIVQDAASALNPVVRIGTQIAEAMMQHGLVSSKAEARQRSLDLMSKVGIPAKESRIDDYPHQFSGGMCQRVVIAAALSCSPKLIIADEPTTALDVTIQDQILRLLVALQAEFGMSLILVTHDMGVVAQTCQRVAVMYGGELVEMAETAALFGTPRHPYTMGLLNCVPHLDRDVGTARLRPIPGAPPDLMNPPAGCRFHPRCPLVNDACKSTRPPLREVSAGHFSRCLRQDVLGKDIWNAQGAGA